MPVTINASNVAEYCSGSTTPESSLVTTIFLDGSGANGPTGVPGTYPDRVSSHVIIDCDLNETAGASVADQGAIVMIVPPSVPGGEDCQITVEIKPSRSVQLCIELNNTTTGFGAAYAAAAASPVAPSAS